jgi:UDP-2,3-diacylglucosamine pyrophosphatase LpxH
MTILVVSDVHLGHENCNTHAFGEFLDRYKSEDIDHFVFLGDIFDLWGRYLGQILAENDGIIEKIANLNADKIHYVVGNHDYYMLDIYEQYGENIPFNIYKSLKIQEDGEKFYFIHGYELDVLLNLQPLTIDLYEKLCKKICLGKYSKSEILNSLIELSSSFAMTSSSQFSGIKGIANNLNEILSKKHDETSALVKEIMKKPDKRRISRIYEFANSYASFLIGKKPDEKLVFGHTHETFINNEKTFANVGSWIYDPLESEKPFNSFLEISEGSMEIRLFKY